MRIAIDAMGGDFAPREVVQGALLAARDSAIQILLVGDESQIRPFLPSPLPPNVSLHPAAQIVPMDASPSVALRRMGASSVAVATKLHKDGLADAVLSAGNTGAASAFALFTLGRIEGIDRPGIATVFPTERGPLVLIDAGANVDCRPRHLADFAVMGAAYAPVVQGFIPGQKSADQTGQKLTVGLLSIGEEEAKGNELTKAAFPLIKDGAARGGYEFFGNVEGRDIGKGSVDVVVCDGFVGNVVLKVAEGFAGMFSSTLKATLLSTVRSKMGALLLAPALRIMKRRLDYTEYGGAVLLGVNGTCIICHGSAKAPSIASAIRIGKQAVALDVAGKIRAAMADAPAEEKVLADA